MNPETPLPQLHADFHRMHDLVTSIGDNDPTAHLLRQLYDDLALTGVERLRFTLTYLAVQHIGTAALVFNRTHCWREMIEALQRHPGRVATGPERRGHQVTGDLARHLMHIDKLDQDWEGIDAYLSEGMYATPGFVSPEFQQANWDRMLIRVERLYGNGPWAAYRTCRLLADVHDWPLQMTGFNNRHVDGQRRALTALYPHVKPSADPAVITQFDQVAMMLQADLQRDGLPCASWLVADSLRLFDRMLAGRYYPGMNLDQQYREALESGLPPAFWLPVQTARAKAFPGAYLAERYHGEVPNTARARIYQLTGKVPHREIDQ